MRRRTARRGRPARCASRSPGRSAARTSAYSAATRRRQSSRVRVTDAQLWQQCGARRGRYPVTDRARSAAAARLGPCPAARTTTSPHGRAPPSTRHPDLRRRVRAGRRRDPRRLPDRQPPVPPAGRRRGRLGVRPRAFVAAGRRSPTGSPPPRGSGELRRAYEVELEREVAARREYELELENELRRETEDAVRYELDALRADIAALSGLRDEVARVSRLRGDIAALTSLRDEVARVGARCATTWRPSPPSARTSASSPELRADMSRLRGRAHRAAVQRDARRADRHAHPGQPDAGRPRTGPTAPAARSTGAPTWADDVPPRELTGGWPAVRLDEPPGREPFDEVRGRARRRRARPCRRRRTRAARDAPLPTPPWDRPRRRPGWRPGAEVPPRRGWSRARGPQRWSSVDRARGRRTRVPACRGTRPPAGARRRRAAHRRRRRSTPRRTAGSSDIAVPAPGAAPPPLGRRSRGSGRPGLRPTTQRPPCRPRSPSSGSTTAGATASPSARSRQPTGSRRRRAPAWPRSWPRTASARRPVAGVDAGTADDGRVRRRPRPGAARTRGSAHRRRAARRRAPASAR